MNTTEIIAVTVAVTTAVCYVGATLLPPIGRFIVPWKPRFGNALIQLGSDLKGAKETAQLPPGTPSVEAVHPSEKAEVAAEVSRRIASIAPPAMPVMPDEPARCKHGTFKVLCPECSRMLEGEEAKPPVEP